MLEVLARIEQPIGRRLAGHLRTVPAPPAPPAPEPELFEVRSHFGTVLQCDLRTNLLVHAASGHRDLRPVFLARLPGAPGDALIVRRELDGRPLRLPGDRQAGSVIALRLADAKGGGITLRAPDTGLFLAAEPPDGEAGRPVQANRKEASDWETFGLAAPAATAPGGPAALAAGACLDVLFRGVSAESLSSWLSAQPDPQSVPFLQILLRRLPPRERLRLSFHLRDRIAPELLLGARYA